MMTNFPAALDVERRLVPAGEADGAAGSPRVRVIRYVPDFVMDTATREVKSRSDRPQNPAVLVAVAGAEGTNTYWLFSKHPEFSMRGSGGHGGDAESPLQMVYAREDAAIPEPRVKAFRSTVDVLEGGAPVARAVIAVNSPYSRHGYAIYQTGYNPEDPTWTSLQVVRDPGVPVVYAGFVLMILGLAVLFYLYDRGSGPASRPPVAEAGQSAEAVPPRPGTDTEVPS